MKKFLALIFLLSMCNISWGADPYDLYFWSSDLSTEADVYDRYGNSSYNFFYQLRDVTGASRNDRVAGPQWFATVYENYYYKVSGNTSYNQEFYRRTMGGEIPDVRFYAVGDLLDGFNFLFAEEPQPYSSIWRNYVDPNFYDEYPDPLESFCIVITNGQGEFNLSLGNPYARHFPFWWWHTGTGSSTGATKWWQEGYNDWRTSTHKTLEPIEYIYSNGEIYSRNANDRYIQTYKYERTPVTSGDTEEVIGYTHNILDMSGNIVYTLSGDIDDSVHYWCNPEGNIAWITKGDDKVYDSDNNIAYTLETDTNGDIYICEVREIYEEIAFSDFDENYTFTVNPSGERNVLSGNYLDANVRVRGIDSSAYGSKLGYMSFRQRASFAEGYTNYRESTLIPMVIANVSNGNASDNPLMFDMIVSEQTTNNIVNRIKFTWDAQRDMPDQDLGTFFMIRPFTQTTNPKYNLETRITNRTGTRYELYRYDEINSRPGDSNYRDNYRQIMPDYWKYDLTADMYGTLPDHFLLDAHSQIAPGLVTVYQTNVGSGYNSINTQYDTSESFRLYEYSTASPKNLRLNYKRVAGMTTAEGAVPYASSNSNVILQGFNMQFADIIQDDNETEYQLTNLMGKPPAMIPARLSTVAPVEQYIRSSALNAFSINQPVPDGDDFAISYEIISQEPASSSSNEETSVRASVAYSSDKAALQPVAVRLRIPRQYRLINDIWNELDSASNSRQLFERFANHGAIWVRSAATREQDTNLFTALNTRGSSLGVSASDCIRAFLYDDALYLDFIVFIADAKSTRTDRTAFIEVFKDDDVPYILIGDGAVDKVWNLTFFVDATGDNPDTRTPDVPDTPTPSNGNQSSGSGGGGGCSSVMLGAIALVILFARKR